ncbi:acyl-CoA dehydrogenase family protein [Arthrobacter sp. JSM 101049]|uniref:acyl-CoA dehydrogenase family protein n=1 Tax=Arthrobacter sp. JSM 101049 TaxID=929097 RepID=UPI00356AA71F
MAPTGTVNSDYFLLDEELTDEETALRDRIRAYVDTDILPVINEYWERAEFPHQLRPGLAALGIIGSTIEGYGCPGLSRRAAGIAAREIARGDGSINTYIGVHSSLCMGTIAMLGSEEQKQRWLPNMATLERTGAFALTEPDHGSDSVALETIARRDGGDWVLTGHKRWIGNGDAADVVVIFARDQADGHVKGFVMEKDDDGAHPRGYEPTVITGKMGKRAILQSDIVIEDLRIPEANRLVGCNSFHDVSKVLTATRGGAAWEAVGHAMAAYEIAASYAAERRQFGKPIASFQLVQHKLANMLAELTAMQLMCTRMAELADSGRLTGPMASMVKMSTAQKAKWICSEARDMLAGNGVLLERHVARHLTDMDIVSTYEGTDSIQSLLVGRDITGISAFR